MDNVRNDTHVVSVMTDLHKETCAAVRDEKDDCPLPHQIPRPRLTKREKILKNRPRGKLFRQKERNSVPLHICKNPSCKCWHPPVCQNYKSETGCNLEERVSSDMLRLRKSPVRSPRRWCERISCIIEGVNTIGLCISRLPSEKVYSTEGGTL